MLVIDILGSIDEKIENNDEISRNLEDYAVKVYQSFTGETKEKIPLGSVIELFDSKRIPLSSREREKRKGKFPYYGATGILDYVNDFIFSGEYVLLAEDGSVIDNDGNPIIQLVDGDFWVNNHAHIMQGINGYTNYSLYVALKKLQVSKAVTGAVQLKINQANLCSLEIPLISEVALLELNKVLSQVFNKILHIRKVNQHLDELKRLYLKKFFD